MVLAPLFQAGECAGFFIGRSIKKRLQTNGAKAPYDGADVILVAQNATYTIKHQAQVSAGKNKKMPECAWATWDGWFNMGEQTNEFA